MAFLEKIKQWFGKEEEQPVYEPVVIEHKEPVSIVQTPPPEPKKEKEGFECSCGYKFSLNLDNNHKIVCPWCGRKQ